MAQPGGSKQVICCFLLLQSFLLPCLAVKRTSTGSSEDGIVLPIEHAFGIDAEFTELGTLHFKSLRTSYGSFHQDTLFSPKDHQHLQGLANDGDVYRIRIPSKMQTSGEDHESTEYVSSFILACSLYEARLSSTITVTADSSGNVLGISISVPGQKHCENIEVPNVQKFTTTIKLELPVAGPLPETQVYVEKLEEEKAKKATGDPNQNKSFFQKYWMYIVPVMLIMLLNSGGASEQGGRGGGGS